ncbi:MAG: IscS subfamily cysteine desulfurase [Oscillospiraceae bacterium]|nr:IscS subfamily cysteine desulfurase [Oscillospiraceae bacterium]
MKRIIYADNAATTPMSETAIKVMVDKMENCYGNASSLHTVGQEAAVVLQKSRETMAKYINAEPREIYFTSCGSESDNQAILTGIKVGARKNKKHIISSKFEHHGILTVLERLVKQGYEVTFLDVYRNGMVKAEDVANAIREDTALVTIMYANNEIGTIQPIKEIGQICKDKKVVFHTDAVQAGGHLPIDVAAENIDMLSFSAHKFNGPKGVGILYCKRNINPERLIEGGGHERGRRAGTENIPGIAGMAAAFEESCLHMQERAEYTSKLRDKLIAGLSKVPNSIVNGDLTNRLPGNVNMCFEGVEGESLLLMLDMKGIEASSGSACTSGSLDPSHVLLALGLPHEVAHGSLRLSISHYNTEEDIDYIIETVPQVVSYLRKMSPVWEKIEKGEEKSKLEQLKK